MIAAIALTLRQRKDSKFVSPSDQVRVKARDRLTVLGMKVTQAAQPQAADSLPKSESKP
jgi:NADH-quinone oxidoreductase subunit J